MKNGTRTVGTALLTGITLLPYMANEPCFVYTENWFTFLYNGYAIFSDSKEDTLKKYYCQKIFCQKHCKPYAGNYFFFG
jgi:hypothetical protein